MSTTIGGIGTSATTPLAGTEVIELEQGGTTKKTTAQAIADLATDTTLAVDDEGVEVSDPVIRINFTGAGVTATETSPGVVEVDIPGMEGDFTLTVQEEGVDVDAAVLKINFTGTGATVTQTAPGEIEVNIPGLGAQPYDIGLYISGLQPDNTVSARYVFPRAVDFPANFANSRLKAQVAATADAVYTVKKNGTNVGTITVAAAATTGTFSSSGGAAVSFAAGDTLDLVTPTPQDSTLASVSITFAGTRT